MALLVAHGVDVYEMKIRVAFKCVDAIYYALDGIEEQYKEEMSEIMNEWLDMGEYIDIEFDTDTRGARLIFPEASTNGT